MTVRTDLTGRRFGRLVVIGPTERPGHVRPDPYRRFWLCRCDCGREHIVCTNNLAHGHTRSCGCLRSNYAKRKIPGDSHSIDLTGRRFGRLVVIRPTDPPAHVRPDTPRHFWLCRCDCGAEHVICRGNLTAGHVKSCGCLRREAPGAAEGRRAAAKTRAAQARRITWQGEALTAREWSVRIGIPVHAIHLRLRRGWTVERALTTQTRPGTGEQQHG